MKKNCIIILTISILFLSSNFSYAKELCTQKGYTIAAINGIFTDEKSARDNRDKLKDSLPNKFNNQPLKVDYLYNPSHLLGIRDLLDAAAQGFFDRKSDYDFVEMHQDASDKITTQKILFIGHSQGNFYANSFYDKLASKPGGVPKESLGIYSIASPADKVSGGGKYITSDTDKVITTLAGSFFDILPPNVHMPLSFSDGNGHSLDVYLKYEGKRIVEDIKSSLKNLKNNDEQLKDEPCIARPEDKPYHMMEGRILSSLDFFLNEAQKGGKFIADAVYNTGASIGKVIRGAAIAVGNIFKSSPASVVGSLDEEKRKLIERKVEAGVKEESNVIPSFVAVQKTPPKRKSEKSQVPTKKSVEKISAIIKEPINSVIKSAVVKKEEFPKVSSRATVSPAVFVSYGTGYVGGSANNEEPANENQGNNNTNTNSGTNNNSSNSGSSGNSGNSGNSSNTPPDTTPPAITLLGNNPIEIEEDTSFTDLGATAVDEKDGTREVVVSGSVDASTPGIYTLIYSASDLSGNTVTVTRTVNVTESVPAPTPTPDTTPPVIVLSGEEEDYITLGDVYTDPGATASDDVDGAVNVLTAGAVDSSTPKSYTLTYTAVDSAGNTSKKTRKVKVSTYKYISKYTFGKNNGDGRDWQAWVFNGSVVYDWTDVYVDGYLHEQFKVKTNTSTWCSQCLERGIFRKGDPKKGFEASDVTLSGLEGNPQNNMNGLTYDVEMKWDSEGYSYKVSHGGITDAEGHTDISGVDENMWVAWDGSFNSFRTFPSGGWMDNVSYSPMSRAGGSDMMMTPYPVYREEVDSLVPFLSIPNKGERIGTGISATRGRENLTPFSFEIYYEDPVNQAPENVLVHVKNSSTGTSLSEIQLSKLTQSGNLLGDGDYTNGESYSSSLNYFDAGEYEYYFTAGSYRYPENGALYFSAIPSTYKYISKYTFGTDNGDGRDWQAWVFNGSIIYDWKNTYIEGYLKEKFKIKTYYGYWCSVCLERGIFNHDPEKGFEAEDVTRSYLEGSPQNKMDNKIYDVSIKWDSEGYTYIISQDGAIDSTGRTDVAIDLDTYVAWDDSYNNFRTFPSGTWYDTLYEGLSGGANMMMKPYIVYDPSKGTTEEEEEEEESPIETPSITSYTFNGVAGDITINPSGNNKLLLAFTASENVEWISLEIENQNEPDVQKMFFPGNDCDGKNTCTESWNGSLSAGGKLKDKNGIYRVKVHIKDEDGNEFYDYVTPYIINVNTSL